jgi:hypothetical protein
MYYSYVEIEYVATSFSPARTDLALMLLIVHMQPHGLPNFVTFLHTFHTDFYVHS